MTKDVLISISGLHYSVDEENGAEPLEVITPASYYFKNGKHYVLYDEVVEGIPGTIKNTIKITDDRLFEINKSGIASTRMVFKKDRINMTNYQTPFGEMVVGIHTKDMRVDVQEENIDVHINYALDVNNEPLSECEIKVNIRGVNAG